MHPYPVQRTPVSTDLLVFGTGDDVVPYLEHYITEADITAGRIGPGIGAFAEAVLGFFNTKTNTYEEIPVDEPVEVLSLTGNVALFEGTPRLHVHASLSTREGSCVGGHLISALTGPTLEVFVTSFDATLRRTVDPATGLPLLEG